jgi:hypothetical protein
MQTATLSVEDSKIIEQQAASAINCLIDTIVHEPLPAVMLALLERLEALEASRAALALTA